MKTFNKRPKNTCCICGEELKGHGHNPWPVIKEEDARCCYKCNATFVIPARIKLSKRKETDNEN